MGSGAPAATAAKERYRQAPSNDHRVVLGGILWVARTGSSWREMPEEYGDFTTAYKRWRLWRERGLWRRILEVLGHEDLPGPATKAPN